MRIACRRASQSATECRRTLRSARSLPIPPSPTVLQETAELAGHFFRDAGRSPRRGTRTRKGRNTDAVRNAIGPRRFRDRRIPRHVSVIATFFARLGIGWSKLPFAVHKAVVNLLFPTGRFDPQRGRLTETKVVAFRRSSGCFVRCLTSRQPVCGRFGDIIPAA